MLYIFQANNLYGVCLDELLPCGEFEWIDDVSFVFDEWENWRKDDPYGYVIECDLEIPPEKHKLFDQFPPIATTSVIKYDQLSPYSKSHVSENYKSIKLISDLHPKEKYVVGYQNLQFYLKHGVVLTKVHRYVFFFFQ